MLEPNQYIVLQLAPPRQAEELLQELRRVLPSGDRCSVSRKAGFDNIGVLEIVIYVSSLRVASKVAEIVVAWMKQKSSRSVTVNGVDIVGYSAHDVAKILGLARRSSKHEP